MDAVKSSEVRSRTTAALSAELHYSQTLLSVQNAESQEMLHHSHSLNLNHSHLISLHTAASLLTVSQK